MQHATNHNRPLEPIREEEKEDATVDYPSELSPALMASNDINKIDIPELPRKISDGL